MVLCSCDIIVLKGGDYMNDFEFHTDSLSEAETEINIRWHCGIDYFDKAVFDPPLSIGSVSDFRGHSVHKKPYKHIGCYVSTSKDDTGFKVKVFNMRNL